MLPMPDYYNSEWYDKSTHVLKEGAPEELQNEYRFYHASAYYSDENKNEMVAQYIDKKDGKYYVIDVDGAILYAGVVDTKKYPHRWNL